MDKAYIVVHKMIGILSWGMLLFSFFYLLFIWKTLPEQLGVHFSHTGEFDLYDDKVNAFYPYLVGGGVLLFCELMIWVAKRIKSGLKIDDRGERRLRMATVLCIDIVKGSITVFFTYWSYCVITQSSMSTEVPRVAIVAAGIGFVWFMIAAVMIRIKYGRKE